MKPIIDSPAAFIDVAPRDASPESAHDVHSESSHSVQSDLSRNLSRLESLLESAQLLHASLDLDDLLRHLLRSSMGRLLVGRGLIAVEEDNAMRLKLVRGFKSLTTGESFDEATARDAGVYSLLPIGEASHPIGWLGLGRPPAGVIEPDEEESLKALLGIAASGIANARAHTEANRLNANLDEKIQELRALLDLVRGLSATLEPDGVASLLMLTLAGRWAVRKAALVAWKEGHPLVTRARGMTLANLESIAEEYKATLSELPEALLVEALPETTLKQTLVEQGAALLFTLRSGEAVNGIVALGARPGGIAYTEADLEFGAGLVAQASVAFENAWYVRETIERKKIEQELELAASIQEKLFPESLPTLPGYDLAARNRPARQCGGDYYDALKIEAASVGEQANGAKTTSPSYLFCVADVSGKGLPASLLMSNVQATLRALLGRTPSIAELAAETSALLYATTPANKYVTAVLVRFDPETGEVAYVNAGHNGGLLLRAGGAHEWLKPTGTPIGLFPGLPFEQATFQMQQGDLLALFSDGFPEAQDLTDAEFGEDRLLAYIQSVKDNPSAAIVAGAFAEVDSFAGSAPQFDDITLLIIKRNE